LLKLALLAIAAAALLAPPAQARVNHKCTDLRAGIVFYREATWKWQDKLHATRYRSSNSDKWARSCRYLRWVATLWQDRSRDTRLLLRKRVRHLAYINSSPQRAICHAFGRYCYQAIRVADCESGGTFSVYASNGQYLGMFQMGESERYLYGHGNTPLEQAQAAYRYFAASGYDWSPWSCKPWW
jgi:hypothetical protein